MRMPPAAARGGSTSLTGVVAPRVFLQIPGAWHVPMSAVMRYGIVNVLGQELIHALLSTKRNSLIIVYSQARLPPRQLAHVLVHVLPCA